LTPVAKSYGAENGILSVSQGIQILGGYGYCQEFPMEQYFRDVKIHTIHEGTTGIQAMDLLGRKVVMKNGETMRLYIAEVEAAMQQASHYEHLKPYADRLKAALEQLQNVTLFRVQYALKGEVEEFLADATLYLEFFGIFAVAWQWLVQGTVAEKALRGDCPNSEKGFYQGKLHTMKYFFHYEVPKIQGLGARLMEADGLTVDSGAPVFED